MEKNKWILCPVCNSKTRLQIREDTELRNFPLYCPKCKQETLVDVKKLQVTIIKEPDAETQSRCICEILHRSSALFYSILEQARQLKKTELWRAVSSCLLESLQTRFEFGGIFMCWSAVTALLLIRSSSYLHSATQPRE